MKPAETDLPQISIAVLVPPAGISLPSSSSVPSPRESASLEVCFLQVVVRCHGPVELQGCLLRVITKSP